MNQESSTRIPGFTAAASLYRTAKAHEPGMPGITDLPSRGVVPQAPPGPWYFCRFERECQPIVRCEGEPFGCQVVGYQKRRCCYIGINRMPVGCKWVDVPAQACR